MKAEALGAEGADRSTITLHILTQICSLTLTNRKLFSKASLASEIELIF